MKLTSKQCDTLKMLMEYCQFFSDKALHILENSGLDKIDGCQVQINVDPKYKFTTREIKMGSECDVDSDFGFIHMAKGKEEERYEPTGRNTPEYEILFGRPEVAERIKAFVNATKPLPPDGLWVSDSDDTPFLGDRGDLNAEVSEAG